MNSLVYSSLSAILESRGLAWSINSNSRNNSNSSRSSNICSKSSKQVCNPILIVVVIVVVIILVLVAWLLVRLWAFNHCGVKAQLEFSGIQQHCINKLLTRQCEIRMVITQDNCNGTTKHWHTVYFDFVSRAGTHKQEQVLKLQLQLLHAVKLEISPVSFFHLNTWNPSLPEW